MGEYRSGRHEVLASSTTASGACGKPDRSQHSTTSSDEIITGPRRQVCTHRSVIEFILGILITVGFMTRIAAFIASGEMAFAYFYQHWPPLQGGKTASLRPMANGGELAIMFCFAFLLIATTVARVAAADARRRGVAAGAAPRRRWRR